MVFCEGVYLENTPINGIIEFGNTISSIFLSLCSLIPIYTNINNVYIQRSSLFLCGIGSTLYHATMKNKWKLFDEIPMIMITTFTVLNILKKYKNKFYIFILTCYLFFAIWFDSISTYENNNDDIDILIFRILFILPFIIILIYYIYIYKYTSDKKIYKNTLLFGSIGCVSWLVDMHLCNYYTALFYLHSIWHISIGITAYYIFCINTINNKKYIYRIGWKYKIIPIIYQNNITEILL